MNSNNVTETIGGYLRQRKYQFVLVGLGCLLVGFLVGYEYRGYVIAKALSDAFNGKTSNVRSTASESEKVKELQIGDSFEAKGLQFTLLDIQRSDASVTLSDDSTRDSKVGVKIRVENKTREDHAWSESDFTLKSKVDDNKITKVSFWFDGNKNYTPQLESTTLIDGAVAEGWLTYFLPKEISNDDLQFIYDDYSTKVKFRLR
jgi:hypothetical protein